MHGAIYGEETITDSILLEIAKQNFFNLRILQTPKNIEGAQGTDWEWFVGSNENGWIRYAIQAKKMNTNSMSYQSLNHKVGSSPNEEFQIDILRTFAAANGAIPLYNFYNYYPEATESDHWHCSKSFDRELLGWTFTTLSNVQNAIDTYGHRTFDKIHRQEETLPIRCLFTCPHITNLYNEPTGNGDNPNTFFGEEFTKIQRLPNEFLFAQESGILEKFPENLYKPEINIYPRRIAIIEIRDQNENGG